MSDMSGDQLEKEFRRQVRLCQGVGAERMIEIIKDGSEQFVSQGRGRETEYEEAKHVACQILNDKIMDPDSTLAMLSRQYLRSVEKLDGIRDSIPLDEAANQICRNLVGKDNEIALIMEDGSAYVELMEGYKRIPLPDSADKSLWEQLQDAIAEVTPSPENEDA